MGSASRSPAISRSRSSRTAACKRTRASTSWRCRSCCREHPAGAVVVSEHPAGADVVSVRPERQRRIAQGPC
eukprot:354848-Chlamydomonas_euryale.AAC.1